MTAHILDGTATAATIKGELMGRVATLRDRGVVPALGTLLVGDDPGSQWYVNGKHKDCAEVGIESLRIDLPKDASQKQIEHAIESLNNDPRCTGYIVQLPLPPRLSLTIARGRPGTSGRPRAGAQPVPSGRALDAL